MIKVSFQRQPVLTSCDLNCEECPVLTTPAEGTALTLAAHRPITMAAKNFIVLAVQTRKQTMSLPNFAQTASIGEV